MISNGLGESMLKRGRSRIEDFVFLFVKQKDDCRTLQQETLMTDMKMSIKSKRHRASLPTRQPRLLFIRPKTQVYNSTSLIKMPSQETEADQNSRLNSTNLELFRNATKQQTYKYPSSFSLIRPIPFMHPKNVTLGHLQQINFPVLMYTLQDLCCFGTKLLRTSLFSFTFSEDTLQRLLETLALRYNDIAYHNWSHAFSLSLLGYQCLVKQAELKSLFSDQEYFYILIAGFSHDLNHKGTNNSFEVKCQTPLAKQFNNESVLQNMHLTQLWEILEQNPQLNFLLKSSDRQQARKIITRMILSTDMAYHFKKLGEIKQSRMEIQQGGSKKDHRWNFMEQLFHACDIGNPSLNFDSYISWAALLTYQFNEQTVLEESRQVEVTASFIYHDLSTLYKDQVWFLGNLVYPLWKQLSLSWPHLKEYVNGIEGNLRRIQQEQQKLRP